MKAAHLGRGTKHGFASCGTSAAKRKFYTAWEAINWRCSRRASYLRKGIKVEWSNFIEFKNDMFDSFLVHNAKHGGRDTTIERIDNDGNYSKKNCKWATGEEQRANQGSRKKKSPCAFDRVAGENV